MSNQTYHEANQNSVAMVPQDNGQAGASASQIDASQLVSDENSYWGKRLRKFIEHHPEEPFEKCKEALMNDSAAWGVFAALLMTVGAAALSLGRGDFIDQEELEAARQATFNYDLVSYQYVGYNTLAFSCSFVAVIIGTQQYSYFNNIPAEMVDVAIKENVQLAVAPFVYAAVVLQGAGLAMGINLLYYNEAYVCGTIACVAFLVIILAKWLERKSYKGLGL
mmetsp:Transcript_31233/g.27474  ORF Transcript_31233/g.27474 Transcript_31233/m.27474 type:complete len:222 (-) Transcript_31233:136-801(-)